MSWMVAKKIESLQHPLVKHWEKLRKDRSYREKTQCVLVVGKKMVSELSIDALITTDPNFNAKNQYLVTESILKKITGLEEPDGFAGEISMPMEQNLSEKKRILILDRITDPGNLGTLL